MRRPRCAFTTPCALTRTLLTNPAVGVNRYKRPIRVHHRALGLRACADGKGKKSERAFDYIPPEVRKMDEEELTRQLTGDRPPPLEPDVLAALHEKYPQLKEIDKLFEELDKEAEQDREYYPDRAYSWLYLKTRPWVPSTPFKVTCALAVAFIFHAAWKYLSARYTGTVLATMFFRIDLVLLVALGLVVPIIFIIAASRRTNLPYVPDFNLSESENMRKYDAQISNDIIDVDGRDAVTRCVAMVSVTAIGLTVPSILLASVGATQSALVLDIVVRAALIPMALWGWSDLGRDLKPEEKEHSTPYLRQPSEPLIGFARNWRLLMTLQCVAGAFIRSCALLFSTTMPLESVYHSALLQVRTVLGDTFPVAFSLARDPGGVIFLAFLLVLLAFCNALHVYMAASEFGDIKEHRLVTSWLNDIMVRLGVYTSKEEWMERKREPSSAPEGVESYRPSPVMLILPLKPPLFNSNGLLVQQERRMPVFDLLEQEEEARKKSGATHWLESTDNWVVPGKENDFPLTYWANESPDGAMKEFFEMAGKNQYEYDPESDKWVFSDTKQQKNDKNDKNNTTLNNGKTNGADTKPKIPNKDEDGNETVFV